AILKHKGEILHVDVIEEEHVTSLIEKLRTLKDASTVVIQPDVAYIEEDREDHIDVLKEFYTNLKVVDDLMDYTHNVIKVTSLSLTSSKENFNNHIEGKIHDDLHAVQSGFEWIDISNKSVNKGKSLKVIMDK